MWLGHNYCGTLKLLISFIALDLRACAVARLGKPNRRKNKKMKDQEMLAAINAGKIIVKAEFRSGAATARPWNKNGKSGIMKRASYQTEVVTNEKGDVKPLLLEMQLPENADPSLHKFPEKGSKCIFEVQVRQGEKGVTYLDVVAVTVLPK